MPSPVAQASSTIYKEALAVSPLLADAVSSPSLQPPKVLPEMSVQPVPQVDAYCSDLHGDPAPCTSSCP